MAADAVLENVEKGVFRIPFRLEENAAGIRPLLSKYRKIPMDLADACLAHPFVQGLASGELSRGRFQIYVAQDAYFLEAFARAYALALAKSPDREGIAVFKDLLIGVFEELTLHRGYAERWGVSLEPEPLPTTSAYIDFLLSTASLEPVGHTAAAMTPCMRLYAFLGQQLAPKLKYDDFDTLEYFLGDLPRTSATRSSFGIVRGSRSRVPSRYSRTTTWPW